MKGETDPVPWQPETTGFYMEKNSKFTGIPQVFDLHISAVFW